MSDLFSGPRSIRYPTERRSFILTIALLPLSIAVVGFFLRHALDWSEVSILIVTAMVYVAILRGRLLGSGVRVDRSQFPELLAVVRECAELLGLAMPEVFIREDMVAPVLAIGFSPPYAIVISSYYLPHVQDEGLRFLIGRELGHVAAGHTRVSSFFMASGRDNPVIGTVLGGWLRTTEYTADRVGLLCCGSIEAAIAAIVAATFHSFAPRVDHAAFAAQHREIASDPLLRMGEWIGVAPYVTNRVRAIEQFALQPAFGTLRDEFRGGAFRAEGARLDPPDLRGGRRYYWRRAIAFGIDLSLISAILGLIRNALAPLKDKPIGQALDLGTLHSVQWLGGVRMGVTGVDLVEFGSILIYCAVLVALTGQTFGMIVMGLRVVGIQGERVGFGRALWRYAVGILGGLFVVPLVLSAIYRRPLHDWVSRTRVVSSMTPRLGPPPGG